MQGVVSIRAPLSARRGSYPTPYTGPVYVLDAITNNPGAAGGALTNPQGELLGMLGKELRNSQNNMWLNYAIPINELMPSVDDIIAGKVLPREADDAPKAQQPLQLAQLGMVLVPDVLQRTPPYVDLVRDDSPAGEAGIRPDDLVIFVNDRLIQSCKMLLEELEYLEFDAPVDITVMREQELLQFTLDPEIN